MRADRYECASGCSMQRLGCSSGVCRSAGSSLVGEGCVVWVVQVLLENEEFGVAECSPRGDRRVCAVVSSTQPESFTEPCSLFGEWEASSLGTRREK